MKTIASRLLLSGLLLWSCRDGRRQLPPPTPDKPHVLPFSYVYYDYGGPPVPSFAKAQRAVLARYGLTHRGFGCLVTDSLKRAVQQHNDSLFMHLQKRFEGLDEDRLRREIKTYEQ